MVRFHHGNGPIRIFGVFQSRRALWEGSEVAGHDEEAHDP